MAITIDQDTCIGCGTCVDACPVGAIEIGDDGKAHVNEDTCIECGTCVAECPVAAITL